MILPIVDDTAAWSHAWLTVPWYATGVSVWPLDCKPVATKLVEELSLIHSRLGLLEHASKPVICNGEFWSTTASNGGV